MPRFPTADDLILASNLIRDFAMTLNAKGDMCPSCKRLHHEDFEQWEIHKELTAMSKKLRSIPQRIAATKGSQQ